MISLHIDTARAWRGSQNQVLVTVVGLRQRGHRAVLVAHPDGELARRASEGHDVVRLAPAHELDFAAAFSLTRVIREYVPDIIHAHDPHGVAMAAMALSTLPEARRPALVIAQRVDVHLKRDALSRWKYKQVDAAICASDAIRRLVIDDGLDEDRAFTVHAGVQEEAITSQPPVDVHKALWLPAGATVLGNIGALVPHSGQRHLIDAAPAIVRAHPDTQILIFGEGELRPSLQRQIKSLGLDHHVKLVGFRPDILSLLGGLDLFVLSALTGGLATSILDAMAASRAVVATTAGGIPEVVVHGETGLLVPPGHAAALAEAILTLVGDRARREAMGRAGLARVREHFTVDRMVDQTLAVYACVADRRRAAGTASPPVAH